MSAPPPTTEAVPLVLLAGMGCTAALWSRLDLAARRIVTPTLDQPSIGSEVARLLDELPRRFDLVGLSLGGIVAMALVRTAPERVRTLVLASTNPYGPTELQRTAWTDQRRLLASSSARGLQTSLLPYLLSPAVVEHRPDLVELTLGMADELGPERYDRQLQMQGTRIDERVHLSRVGCPTRVLAARDDLLCSVDRHREIARSIPGAQLSVIEGCAHLSPVERPDAVLAGIDQA